MHSVIKNVCDVDKEKHTVIVKWEGDEAKPDRFPTRNCYPMQSDETKKIIDERLSQLQLGENC